MHNPFQEIESRLSKIEHLLQDLQNNYSRNKSESNDQLLTVKQTAELLNLAIQTIYGLVNRKNIPVMKRAGRLYFRKSEIDSWLSRGRRRTMEEIYENSHEILKGGL